MIVMVFNFNSGYLRKFLCMNGGMSQTLCLAHQFLFFEIKVNDQVL